MNSWTASEHLRYHDCDKGSLGARDRIQERSLWLAEAHWGLEQSRKSPKSWYMVDAWAHWDNVAIFL